MAKFKTLTVKKIPADLLVSIKSKIWSKGYNMEKGVNALLEYFDKNPDILKVNNEV